MSFSTDPKDAVARGKGTLDLTLTVNANLTVNFASAKQPTKAQIENLADSLNIAKRAIDAAISAVTELTTATTSKTDLDAEIYETLTYHFKLPALSDRKDWTAWKADLQAILGFFTADRTHLFGLVVVGDTHRLVLKPKFAVVSDKELQEKITNTGGAPEGFANLKKSAWAVIDKNPKLYEEWINGKHKFLPTEWGNIKVDFGLLGTAPRLQIAGTLIHETTHKMKNAVDHCYACSASKYTNLTKDQAMDNADSYAFAAISLYKKKFIMHDDALTRLGSGKTIDCES